MLMVAALWQSACMAALKVSGLRVENMSCPKAVESFSPRFSWVNESLAEERGQRQTAYRIVVAEDMEALGQGHYVWDSGKRKSAESTYIQYDGDELNPLATYHWKVMTWDRKGKASEWSEVSQWTMGLPDNQWTAHWIESKEYDGRAPLFRKSFRVKGKVRSAKVVVSGLGYHELYVNGMRIGDEQLVPNISNYTKRNDLDKYAIAISDDFRAYRVLYLGHDVTSNICEGENVIGAILGRGFYDIDKPGAGSPFGRPCLRLQMVLTYVDGTTETVTTDGTWQTRPSAIMVNGVHTGELYDARQETEGWCTTAATGQGWDSAMEVKGPDGKMTAQMSPSDCISEVLRPESFTKTGDKTYEVDFGKEISGWIRLNGITGKAGDTVRVDFECESPQGIQRYVMKGDAMEDYSPRFTWFVFRKVRITGVDLSRDNVEAEAVNTDVKPDSEFECSNPLFNRIRDIWMLSQRDNMHGCTPSDCPHRERFPYTGDGQTAAEMVMLSYDAAAFYGKWIRDINDAQNRETGYVPNGAPWEPGCGGGVAWGAAMNVIPWQYYVQYGDIQLLRQNYQAMKDQVRYMYTWLTPEGIMFQKKKNYPSGTDSYWMNLGDWCPPKDYPRDQLVHTFYCWLCTDYTARAAAALGLDDEAKEYADKAEEIRAAFHREFYDADAKSYGVAGSNVFALRMGVPDDRLADVRKTLRKEIMTDNGGHLNTGFVASKFFFETLTDNGMLDVVDTVLNKRDFPSFGWWIEQGATTTWEQWDGGNSHNHPMFGSGLTWMYRRLAGVEADESKPGYRHFMVNPMLPDDISHVRYAKETQYGKVESAVTKGENGCEYRISVPVGTTCTLSLPPSGNVSESGKPLSKVKGVKAVGTENGKRTLLLQPGNYKFTVANP